MCIRDSVGPLIDKDAVKQYLDSIKKCKKEGGKFVVEGGVLEGKNYESGCYVKPCIAEVENSYEIVQHETFAPIPVSYTHLDVYKRQSQETDVGLYLSVR